MDTGRRTPRRTPEATDAPPDVLTAAPEWVSAPAVTSTAIFVSVPAPATPVSPYAVVPVAPCDAQSIPKNDARPAATPLSRIVPPPGEDVAAA